MKGITITIDLTVEDIEQLSKKYHFYQEDIGLIQSVYDTMLSYIHGEIFTKMVKEDALQFIDVPISREAQYATAIVTLGAGVDKLQESYLEEETIKEAYIIECLSGELLIKAYTRLEEILYCETGLHRSSYEFLGDRYPLQMIPEVFRYLEQDTVTYNKAYELVPLKSVVLFVELKKEENSQKCAPLNICVNCNNMQCENRSKEVTGRNLNYGYQRIFPNR